MSLHGWRMPWNGPVDPALELRTLDPAPDAAAPRRAALLEALFQRRHPGRPRGMRGNDARAPPQGAKRGPADQGPSQRESKARIANQRQAQRGNKGKIKDNVGIPHNQQGLTMSGARSGTKLVSLPTSKA